MMHDYGCMLRAYRRPVMDAIQRCGERSTFVPILANCFSGSTAEVEVEHAPRRNDRSKYSVMKLVNLHFDLLTSVTDFPLRLLSIAGVGLALAGLLCADGLLTLRLAHGAHCAADDVFTVLSALFVFVGAQLMDTACVLNRRLVEAAGIDARRVSAADRARLRSAYSAGPWQRQLLHAAQSRTTAQSTGSRPAVQSGTWSGR